MNGLLGVPKDLGPELPWFAPPYTTQLTFGRQLRQHDDFLGKVRSESADYFMAISTAPYVCALG